METERIAKFLAGAVSKGCETFELVRDSQVVMSWDPPPVSGVDSLSVDIYETARGDAEGARVARVAFALLGKKNGTAWGRFAFGITPPKATDDEKFTESSLLAELIRDRREMQRMQNSYTDVLFGRMNEMLTVQSGIARRADEAHVQVLTLIEDLISKKDQREINVIQAKTTQANITKTLDGVLPLIPVGINRLLSKATGAPAPLGDEMIEAFLSSLTEEDFQKLTGALSPEKAIPIYEIYRVYAERAEARKKAADEKAAASKPTNGAAS